MMASAKSGLILNSGASLRTTSAAFFCSGVSATNSSSGSIASKAASYSGAIGSRRQSGGSAAAGPTNASILLRVLVALLGGEPEEQRCHAIVARHAAPVRVHPAEAELGLGVAQP